MQKILITAGLLIALVGVAWPWLSALPLGRLPGDIVIDRPGLKLYFPITTMVVVSVAASALWWLLRK